MNLPRSFKSWAVVGGRVREVVVDVKDGAVDAVSFVVQSHAMAGAFERETNDESARAWAEKALAWLKAEAQRATEEDMILRSVESHHETLNAFLRNLSQREGALSAEAASAYFTRCGDLMGPLRAAHMEDLVNRCAEEMKRQAEEATHAP